MPEHQAARRRSHAWPPKAAGTVFLIPKPFSCLVTHERHADGDSTNIARLYRPVDIDPDNPRRCRLCDRCTANAHGLRLRTIPEHIPGGQCRLFSLVEGEASRRARC